MDLSSEYIPILKLKTKFFKLKQFKALQKRYDTARTKLQKRKETP